MSLMVPVWNKAWDPMKGSRTTHMARTTELPANRRDAAQMHNRRCKLSPKPELLGSEHRRARSLEDRKSDIHQQDQPQSLTFEISQHGSSLSSKLSATLRVKKRF